MKESLLLIQHKLAEIPEFKYIDKNWGQLQFEQPPVKFPMALIDFDEGKYQQVSGAWQDGVAIITVVLAIDRSRPTSYQSPGNDDSYYMFDLIKKVHEKLNTLQAGIFEGLYRVGVRRTYSNRSFEEYTLYYQSVFNEYE